MTVTKSNHARQRNELYETPMWAVLALLKHLPPLTGLNVWEPAAGNHRIADVARVMGANVTTSDIETYQREHDAIFDFINGVIPSALSYYDFKNDAVRFDAIITNPPYGQGNHTAVKFVRNALARCNGWVAMLLTAKFDWGSTRVDLFRDNPRWFKKVVLIDRLRWFDGPEAQDGTEDHAWYIWRPIEPLATLPHTRPTIAYEGNPDK